MKKIIYSHICAAAKNNTIGLNNRLAWNIPEDLKFFQKKTAHKAVLMGRKTFESLNRPLPNRLNIVITRRKNYPIPKGVKLYSSLKAAYRFFEGPSFPRTWGQEVFIIGGGEIYKQSLLKAAFIYLTRIHQNYPGDTTYPLIPAAQFKEISKKDCPGPPPYSFITYKNMRL